MRILAIDHGTKRMGVAISDELGMIAQPLEFIPAEPFAEFLARLQEILKEKQVELILVGMPRNMNGSYGPAALKVQEFVAVLKDAVTIPIQTLDERLTSVQANRFLTEAELGGRRRKEKVDKSAAAVLLQGYLDGRTG
jgi:putative Holliday junction resolvase